jgi:citrate synthase
MTDKPPISTTENDEIFVRGLSLDRELLGNVTFTEMFLLILDGQLPSRERREMMDAVLVALTEHGITPSSLAARLVLDAAPESIPGAIAAGTLANGSRFLGTVEEAGTLLSVVAACTKTGTSPDAAAATLIADRLDAGERIPGFGHNLHHDVDPRVERLLGLADTTGTSGSHVAALRALRRVMTNARPGMLPNALGAVAACLLDLGYDARLLRGFGAVARAAGLFGHIADELSDPIARGLWTSAHESFGR